MSCLEVNYVNLWQIKFFMFLILSGIYYGQSEAFNLYIVLLSFVLLFINDIFLTHKKLGEYVALAATGILILLGIVHNPGWLFYLPLLHFLLAPWLMRYLAFSMIIYVVEPEYALIVIGLVSIMMIYLITRINDLERQNNEIRDRLTTDNLKLVEQRNALNNNVEKEIELASLSERNRIARDMHDAVGHSLSSGLLLLESLHHVKDVDKIHDSLSTVQTRMKSGMDDIRQSIHALYSTSLDLESRIEELLIEMTGFETELQYKIISELPYQLKLDLLAITKESLTNVRKHSSGKWVSVYLGETENAITLRIVDNGVDNSIKEYGMGQHSMKETVQKYNGIFNAGFQARGYTVYASINKEAITNESNNRR